MKKRILPLLLSFLAVLSCLTLTACQKEPSKFSAYSFDYFDTVTTVIGYAKDQEEFDRVSADILAELGEYHRLFTIYNRYEGLENLCTINELVDGAHRTVMVDRRIVDMLLYAKQMHALTDGRINVAMGSVLSIWHDYRTQGSSDPLSAKLPPFDLLSEAAAHTDIDCLVIDEQACTVTLTDPKMTLDVGAIAKGYAVEMVAQSLEKKGITGYMLNVGGNVRSVGVKGNGEPWMVGIEQPHEQAQSPYLSCLHLRDAALVTSGTYQRYYIVDGQRYHHIIHPETLMPSNEYLCISVLCPSSAMGDALSTALFCMALEQGQSLVASLPEVEVLWVLSDGTKYTSEHFPEDLQ